MELVTVISFLLIYFWLSWGPIVLCAHKFRPTKSGLISELILYSYIFYIIYILKIITKWNTYHSQLISTFLIIILISNLIWHDLLILFFRANLDNHKTGKWRHINTSITIYTLSNEWWLQHSLPHRSAFGWTYCFYDAIINMEQPIPLLTENTTYYEQRLNLFLTPNTYLINLTPHLNFMPLLPNSLSLIYPTRLGYIPKRFTLWQLLIFLKIWHHLIILIWWNLMIYRLRTRQQTSYNWLYACAFNIYCCFILALLIYFINLIPIIEMFGRYRKYTWNLHKGLMSIADYLILHNDNHLPNNYDYKNTFIFNTHARR